MKRRFKSKRSQEAYGLIEIFVLPILNHKNSITEFKVLSVNSLRKLKETPLDFGFRKLSSTVVIEAISKSIITETGSLMLALD